MRSYRDPELRGESIPAGWRQYARRSPYAGLRVDHFGANSVQLDVQPASGISVSMMKVGNSQGEVRTPGGRWRKMDAPARAIYFFSLTHGGSFRWSGWRESISLTVDSGWLRGSDDSDKNAFFSFKPMAVFQDESVATALEALYEDNLRGSVAGVEFTEALTMNLFQHAEALSAAGAKADGYTDTAIISRACDYIQAFLGSELAVRDIANAAGWNQNICAFARQFKQQAGISPYRYIVQARLMYAKALLQDKNLSLNAVAMLSGFASLSHFSYAFKKNFGLSPSVWSRNSKIL